MRNHCVRCAVLMLFPALFLFACSSSGGGTGGTGIVSRGAISEFGSIVVNGTSFNTGEAEVIVNGESVGIGDDAVLENLDVGRVVTVIGTGSEDEENAAGEQVIYRNDVKGPVTGVHEIDTETLAIEVLGRTVMVNPVTRLIGASIAAIELNDMVEISGFLDDTGTLWATFLKKTGVFDPKLIMEVVGVVSNLDENLQVFQLADLMVAYATADVSDLPGRAPVEGQLVEIRGTIDVIGGEFLALEIGLADQLEVEEADQIEVMGFVTGFTSIYEFVLGSQRVRVSNGAEIVDGTIADIGLGVKLEAEGTLADGILHAWEIEFWEPDQIEVEDIVTDIVSGTRFFVGEQEVITGPNTVYENGMPGDIAPGITIEIKGRLIQGILRADKVSFELG